MLADAYLQLLQTILKHKASVADCLTQKGQVICHLPCQRQYMWISFHMLTLLLQLFQLYFTAAEVSLECLKSQKIHQIVPIIYKTINLKIIWNFWNKIITICKWDDYHCHIT